MTTLKDRAIADIPKERVEDESTKASRRAVLTGSLLLSFTSLFGSLAAAAHLSPNGYNWRVEVMSKLTSPSMNPEGYWLPFLGIVLAMVFAYPFARFIAEHLAAGAPRFARYVRESFKWSFILVIVSMVAQFAQPWIGMRKLHTVLVQIAGGLFASGMFICWVCAIRDRFCFCNGQKLLPRPLAYYWGALILPPIACMGSLGLMVALAFLGQEWAEELRQSFRHTMFWHLAFWEWVGAGMVFAFLTGTVFIMPGCPRTGRAAP